MPEELTLLPCPFCGSNLISVNPQAYGFSVHCYTCGVMKKVHSKFRKQVQAEWNQRLPPVPVAPEEVHLKYMLDRRNSGPDRPEILDEYEMAKS